MMLLAQLGPDVIHLRAIDLRPDGITMSVAQPDARPVHERIMEWTEGEGAACRRFTIVLEPHSRDESEPQRYNIVATSRPCVP